MLIHSKHYFAIIFHYQNLNHLTFYARWKKNRKLSFSLKEYHQIINPSTSTIGTFSFDILYRHCSVIGFVLNSRKMFVSFLLFLPFSKWKYYFNCYHQQRQPPPSSILTTIENLSYFHYLSFFHHTSSILHNTHNSLCLLLCLFLLFLSPGNRSLLLLPLSSFASPPPSSHASSTSLIVSSTNKTYTNVSHLTSWRRETTTGRKSLCNT